MESKNIYATVILCFLLLGVQAQNYHNPNRHSTNSFDGWISCDMADSPNTNREQGHWVMYDLGQEYTLQGSHIWNINDPDNLDAGIKNLAIDYSEDGITWKELPVFNLDQSLGSLYYNGVTGPDFTGVSTRYLLFTALDNYGGACFGLSEIKIIVEASILPIELSSFEVNCDKSTIINKISWKTNSVINVEKIEVERSIDNKHWTVIHSVLIKNDFEEEEQYSVDDYNTELSYYRLKTTENDGNINYSDIVFSDCINDKESMTIIPNPASDICRIGFYSQGLNTYQLSIYDMTGKQVSNRTYTKNEDHTEIILNAKDYNSGQYFIQLQSDTDIMIKKWIVL